MNSSMLILIKSSTEAVIENETIMALNMGKVAITTYGGDIPAVITDKNTFVYS